MIATDCAAAGISGERLRLLSDVFNAAVERSEIPGAVVLVARRGHLALHEAFGFRDREVGSVMTKDAVFRLASMTKPLVSLAAMILIEEGKLTLGTPVGEIFPALANLSVGIEASDGNITLVKPARQILVLDLLRHTSGLTGGHLGNSAVKQRYAASGVAAPTATREQFLSKLAELPLQFSPGTMWGYGLSVDLLGNIIEEVSGISLDQFIGQRLSAPLQMKDTGFSLSESYRDRIAEPQVDPKNGKRPPMRDPFVSPPRFSGNGNMFSTAWDYGRFCQMLLNGGTLDGTRLVSRSTIALMAADHLTPAIEFDPDVVAAFGVGTPSPAFGASFGLGFAVRTRAGGAAWYGSIGELTWVGSAGTLFWVDPKEDLYAVLMMQAPPQLAKYAMLTRSLVYQALD